MTGDFVRITAGFYEGMTGTVTAVSGARAHVRLTSTGQTIAVPRFDVQAEP